MPNRPVDVPRFSIITVCFNAEATVAATAASLAAQTCTDYEWLVVDGASRDATLALVDAAQVPNKRVYSERDRGIYDAMNKAIGLACGEWLYFLNAGDALADATVLADFAAAMDRDPAAELAWGDMLYCRGDEAQPCSFAHVNRSMLLFEDLNHQALFARRSLFQRHGGFNLDFRTSADFDWLVRVVKAGARLRYVPRTVGRFAVGGMHAADVGALTAERRRLRLQYTSPRGLALGMFAARVRRRWRLWRAHGA